MPLMMPFLTQISNRFSLAKNAYKPYRATILGLDFSAILRAITHQVNNGGR
jgi:hypothetical protein